MNNDIRIYSEVTHPLNLNNSGTLNEQNLQFAKKTMLFDLLRNHADELIRHKQHYPQGDISDVELKADFIIMSTKNYSKMLKIIENLPKERQETIDKYLNFPKLKVNE